MALAWAFGTTPGTAVAFSTTPIDSVFATTSAVPTIFATTPNDNVFATTSAIAAAFASTVRGSAFATTANIATAFATTFLRTEDPTLALKIGSVAVTTDCESVTITDGTEWEEGEREEYELWLVYKTPGASTWTYPDTQDGDLEPWEATVEVTDKGIYQIAMIAAPAGTDYDDFKGTPEPIEYALQNNDWYAVVAGVLVDCSIEDCVREARRKFVLELMDGGCYDLYDNFFQLRNGIQQQLALGEFNQAQVVYERLKLLCAEEGCGCGC